MNRILAIPIAACIIVIILHVLAMRFFPKLGLLDRPERYGEHRKPIPYPTGIIAVLTFVTVFAFLQPLLSNPWSFQHIGLLGSIVVLALFSFLDDRAPLPWWLRLLIQTGCALAIFLTGTRIFTLTNPLAGLTGFSQVQLDTYTIPSVMLGNPSLIGAAFTVVWLGLTMNALNWFDGIPGQVTTLSMIGFLTIGLLSLSDRVHQPELALIAFVLAGISAGSLLFDIPPPKVVLGDTGAMFFGLLLGVLTIYTGGKVATAFLVLGVPLIDFAIVIVRRLHKGTSIVLGNHSDEHLHHRLLRKGWSPRSIILLTAMIGTAFGITALFLTTTQKLMAAVLLLGIMMLLSWYSGRIDN